MVKTIILDRIQPQEIKSHSCFQKEKDEVNQQLVKLSIDDEIRFEVRYPKRQPQI